MASSLVLQNIEVQFVGSSVSLIHIPLQLYSHFVSSIIQLLLPAESNGLQDCKDSGTLNGDCTSQTPWAYALPFVNISVTPIECSITCPEHVVKQLFKPAIDALDEAARASVHVSKETYVPIRVDGAGSGAARRVLELTSPLAMSGISIFFITTYHSDYVLVPERSRTAVSSALEAQGLEFSELSESFVVSPGIVANRRSSISTTLSDDNPFFLDMNRPPSTPPPSSVEELQARTWSLLKRRDIVPHVDPSIRLVQCTGRKDTLRGGLGAHESSILSNVLLKLGLIKSLTSIPPPKFLSLTLTDSEPASLLIEQRLLVNFLPTQGLATGSGGGGSVGGLEEVLLGSIEDILVPISFDFRNLPMESTGIVCGISGRLVAATATSTSPEGESDQPPESVEMYYLSTARAGNVVVADTDLEKAMVALTAPKEKSNSIEEHVIVYRPGHASEA